MARAGFFARRHFKRGMFGPVIFMQVGFSGCRIPLFFFCCRFLRDSVFGSPFVHRFATERRLSRLLWRLVAVTNSGSGGLTQENTCNAQIVSI